VVLDLIRLIRPKQWAKNLLVFAGLIFTGQATHSEPLTRALLAFVGMCLVSSAVYVANDLADVERDRNHPTKKNRPIAAGKVPVFTALILIGVFLLLGLGINVWLSKLTFALVVGYLVLQLLYSGVIKKVAIADVFAIAFGFVLRAAVGAAAIDVKISPWLLLCAGSLSLTLGFGKRRAEFMELGSSAGAARESLRDYTEKSLDFLVACSALGAALCYAMYVLESPTGKAHPGLFLTIPFVYYGVCRYLLVLFKNNDAGEPENLLFKDRHILFAVLGFIVTSVIVMQNVSIPLLEIAK